MIEYIAADYREGTGWAWKLLPLRRMDLTKKEVAEKRPRSKASIAKPDGFGGGAVLWPTPL